MIWINGKLVKSIFQIIFATCVLLFLIEGCTALIFYHQLKLPGWSVSSAVHLFISRQALNDKFTVEIVEANTSPNARSLDKLHTVLMKREEDENENTYPSYLFEPQYHNPSVPYFLGNVASANIIYCNENGFFNSWTTDEIGFRNPPSQINSPVDYVLIGDSFTAGACEQEDGTIPGFFRSKGLKVANLARGGSGPLFQLATLVEYGHLFQGDELIWIVFTGNDLANLMEEKGTRLGLYMDKSFSQNLYKQRADIQSDLKMFLNTQLKENEERFLAGIPYPANVGYGEALDSYGAQKYESKLLKAVATRIYDVAKEQNKTLRVVILNHHRYDQDFKGITAQAIKEFAAKKSVKYLELSSEFLTIHKNFYTKSGTHFNSYGYNEIGRIILGWLESSPLESVER
tara:strand:- start:3846 stop:5051 length:1206 start_codon:yes stop_codon:yes gene_type:complete